MTRKKKRPTEPQPKPKAKRKRQIDPGVDEGPAKKRRKHDSTRSGQTPSQPEADSKEDTLAKPSLKPPVPREAIQSSFNPPMIDRRRRSYSTLVDAVETLQRKKELRIATGNDGHIVDCSTALSLDQMLEKERVKLKRVGYISTDDSANEGPTINCSVAGCPDAIAKDAKALGMSVGERYTSSTTDTSIEKNAAHVWPRCQRPCAICRTAHVAIPGSPLSETCTRISVYIWNAPFSRTEENHHQSILVPTDTYELSILGWLIWSTYAHQVSLRDAKTGLPGKKKRPKDYISTEIGRLRDNAPWKAECIKFFKKSSFQTWWEGKRITGSSGMRWLVITFPWDMGDTNILDASFGAKGHLFSLPTVGPRQDAHEPASGSQSAIPSSVTTEKMRDLQITEDEGHERANDGCREMNGGGETVKEDTFDIRKDKNNMRKPSHSFPAKVEAQNGPSNPAFHVTWRSRRPAVMTAIGRMKTVSSG
jgi:hypothetical protein